jgi:succinate dehydrogenase/fumarate reductase-like Fe-S protein
MGMPNAYRCMICGVFKDTFASIKSHYDQHTKADVANMLDIKNAYRCNICNACTESCRQMIDHYRIIHQM